MNPPHKLSTHLNIVRNGILHVNYNTLVCSSCVVFIMKVFLLFSNTPLSPLESKLISREVADGRTKGCRSRRVVVLFVCFE